MNNDKEPKTLPYYGAENIIRKQFTDMTEAMQCKQKKNMELIAS
jgi:hypothetical protein